MVANRKASAKAATSQPARYFLDFASDLILIAITCRIGVIQKIGWIPGCDGGKDFIG
ncbi:MAG: hypothetical protein ABR577_05785 [Pyrinomonadaceae bacterium]